MENKHNLTRQMILQRLFIAFSIITVCLLFSLYLFDLIRLSFLENAKFRLIITGMVLFLSSVYLFIVYRKKSEKERVIGWKGFTFLSLLFEGIGFWWIDTPFGYVMILLGLVFLIFGFVMEYVGK